MLSFAISDFRHGGQVGFPVSDLNLGIWTWDFVNNFRLIPEGLFSYGGIFEPAPKSKEIRLCH